MSQNEKSRRNIPPAFSFCCLYVTALCFEYKAFASYVAALSCCFLYEFKALRVFLDYIGQITVFGFYCLDFRIFRSYNVKAFYACAKQHTTL